MTIRHKLRQPSEVRQTSQATCWAAALESWLVVCLRGARKYRGETELITTFKQHTSNAPSLSLYNGTSIEGLRKIASDPTVGMSNKTFVSTQLGIGAMARIDPQEFLARLRKHGHLFVVYSVPGGAHANVVYGFDGMYTNVSDPTLEVMDPGKGYQTKLFSVYADASPVFLGWPAF